MIRTKGEAGTGNVVEVCSHLTTPTHLVSSLFHQAVRHARAVNKAIRHAAALSPEELYSYAKDIGAPYELLKETAKLRRLPVVSFAAGGIATPADAAMMMQLGCDGGEPERDDRGNSAALADACYARSVRWVWYLLGEPSSHLYPIFVSHISSQSGDPAKRAGAIVQAVCSTLRSV